MNRIPRMPAEEVLRTFGEVRLGVFGGSIAPSIPPGDFISVQRAALHVWFGKGVLFSRWGQLFLHRGVQQNGAHSADVSFELWSITRGGRLGVDDPPICRGELLGQVVSIQRGTQRLKPILGRGRSRQLLVSVGLHRTCRSVD